VSDSLYFVHISDSHIGRTADFSLQGHRPFPCAKRAVEVINHLPQRPDFVIHTGDVVEESVPEAYSLAAEAFDKLQAPLYFVKGNHDSTNGLQRTFDMGPREELSDNPEQLSYAFELKGFRFVVLDARGPAEIDPQGLLSDSQLELAMREAQPQGPPLVIFIHYPVLPLNSIWMDQRMLIQNGLLLHRALTPAWTRLRAVFHGHVHQAMQTFRDGILYVSGASLYSQFGAWPEDQETFYDKDHDPGFGFIHLLPQQTIIHQHTFTRQKAGLVRSEMAV
jgi:Icc protein